MPRAKKADTTKSDEAQAAYRKRAETAPVVTTEGEWKHTFDVAVYWPREGGYGIATSRRTMEDALEAARSDMGMGYGSDPARHRVRIIERRVRVIEVALEPEKEPAK